MAVDAHEEHTLESRKNWRDGRDRAQMFALR